MEVMNAKSTKPVDYPQYEGTYWHRSQHWDVDWHKVEVEQGTFGLVCKYGEGRRSTYVSVHALRGDEWREVL